MCVIYVVEEHDQVLSLWRAQQASSLRVLHLDFHCDMRGLLIDRQAQRAYRIWDIGREGLAGGLVRRGGAHRPRGPVDTLSSRW